MGFENQWIQTKAVKGYVIQQTEPWVHRPEEYVCLLLNPWYHCAFGWQDKCMNVNVYVRDVQPLDQEEAALHILGHIGS